jgi:hypothetical protein
MKTAMFLSGFICPSGQFVMIIFRMAKIHPDLKMAAVHMLGELERNRLEVVLSPCERGDPHRMIRVTNSTNPGWYRDLCAKYPVKRSKPRKRAKPDTAIRRAGVVAALKSIINGEVETEYANRLLPYVYDVYEKFYWEQHAKK